MLNSTFFGGRQKMKNKHKLYSLVLSSVAMVLFLILVSSTASASITETQITKHGTASSPEIYGNRIVWLDMRNGQYTHDLYMYDLSTKKETRITNSGLAYDPDIYRNKVVWIDPVGEYHDFNGIYVKDLSTNKQDVIAQSTDAIGSPKIYGDNIVYYLCMTSGNFPDIIMYDLSTSKFKGISTSRSAGSPDIYGNRIVWEDWRNYWVYNVWSQDIYMYDLSTSKEKRITTSGTAERPAIYNNKIVWQDNRSGNWDIYMYDISTGEETQITTNKFDQIAPAIYGNTIVWQDNRSGNWNIYAYDLVTHQQIHTTDKSNQVAPAIYNNKIVWTDYRSGKPDIYMGTISYLPVATFTASPLSGKKPLTVSFIDKSMDAYYWSWDFGDKSTSKLQSPSHKYTKAGKYTVTLTVKNAAGKNTVRKTNYIIVK
jgi:beta propeller repeat protein